MTPDVEVAIVGAGISGIGTGIELLRRGRRSFVLLEAAEAPGGTWRDNTYPGVAVDIPTAAYCFSFERDFPWSRTYAPGAELQRYVLHCAEKYGVMPHMRFGARVVRSTFDPVHDLWTTELAGGGVVRSRHLVVATGILSQPRYPDIQGLGDFEGVAMHTARWDHGVDLAGRRVAIIGTGASAVQVVPEIAPRVAELRVFQRTPIYVSPRFDRAAGRPGSVRARLRRVTRPLVRAIANAGVAGLGFAVVEYQRFPFLAHGLQRAVRAWMQRQVRDRTLAGQLVPSYGLGCKRPAPSNDYLAAFNRANVRLVTTSIERITADGVLTRDGVRHPADVLILATGFLTTERGNAPSFEVVNGDGVELGRLWEEHRRQAYGGVSVAGFPNFFLTAGPYSGGLNWFPMLAAHVHHIAGCIEAAAARGATRVAVTRAAHDRYMEHMWHRAAGTVFQGASCATANSYYLDRHGDASLPLPHGTGWRARFLQQAGVRDYEFGSRS